MIDQNIKQFILRALIAAQNAPMVDSTLRSAVRTAFSHTTISDSLLGRSIGELRDGNFIACDDDAVFGKIWQLTPKGRITAKNLP